MNIVGKIFVFGVLAYGLGDMVTLIFRILGKVKLKEGNLDTSRCTINEEGIYLFFGSLKSLGRLVSNITISAALINGVITQPGFLLKLVDIVNILFAKSP